MTKENVLDALAEWICCVANKRELATNEEIKALAEVASLYLSCV